MEKSKILSARELMNLANIPAISTIQEIPLNRNNQVVILFLMPNDNNYYSLFVGIGKDNEYHFELSIEGVLIGKEFDFYEEAKPLPINYFKEDETEMEKELKIGMRRELETMPFDKAFCIGDGEELCHATGYEVCFGDTSNLSDWWNEYETINGTLKYGR